MRLVLGCSRRNLLAATSSSKDPTKGMMLLGFHGVGKTVLLNRLRHMADEKGIHTARLKRLKAAHNRNCSRRSSGAFFTASI